MNERNDGGPAFPTNEERNLYDESIMVSAQTGMSLRDWFAGQALQGILAGDPKGSVNPKDFSGLAYRVADAMLKAREET